MVDLRDPELESDIEELWNSAGDPDLQIKDDARHTTSTLSSVFQTKTCKSDEIVQNNKTVKEMTSRRHQIGIAETKIQSLLTVLDKAP